MKLNDAARDLIGDGTDATLVTLNADGSPQVTVVWMALESTPDGDELVSAHLTEYQKTRNIRRDPRVAVTILATRQAGQQTPYCWRPSPVSWPQPRRRRSRQSATSATRGASSSKAS